MHACDWIRARVGVGVEGVVSLCMPQGACGGRAACCSMSTVSWEESDVLEAVGVWGSARMHVQLEAAVGSAGGVVGEAKEWCAEGDRRGVAVSVLEMVWLGMKRVRGCVGGVERL